MKPTKHRFLSVPKPALWGLVTLVLWLTSSGVWAQPSPSATPVPEVDGQREARFLYPAGRVYKHDKVFPLVLELSNPHSSVKNFNVSWRHDLELPGALKSVRLEPGEKRRFTLNFPRGEIGSSNTMQVNLRTYSTDLQSNPRTFITGLLSSSEERFQFLRTLKLEPDYNTAREGDSAPPLVPLAALAELDHEVLPEGWPMLSALDVIIAYDLQSMALSTAQKSALVSWVCQGGRLVLVSDGRPDEFKGTPFEPHLPMQITSTVTNHGLLQLTGEPTAGAETLYSYHGRPLLMRKSLMQGQLFFLTAPLTKLAPLSVEEAEKLWQLVFPLESTPTVASYGYASGGYNYNHRYNPTVVSNALSNIPELPRTQPGWVALFLLLYAVVVGPINLSLLRRKDKMLLSFLTVPLIALLFAGSAYLWNRLHRPSTVVLRELGLLQVRSGEPRGYGISEALLYSPSAGRVKLNSNSEALCHSSTYNYQNPGAFGLYGSRSDGGLEANIKMATWDVFPLNVESLLSLPAPITGRFQDGTLHVDSPIATADKEAILFSPKHGVSPAFQLKGGSQTEQLTLEQPESHTRFDALGKSSNPKAHPGREALATSLAGQNLPMFDASKTYLLFWNDQILAPINLEASGVHRGEYLVIVELQS